jgi:diguanylate cyclase (GGDEF)-like protein
VFAKVDRQTSTAFYPFLLEILERGSVLIVVLDAQKRIVWANHAFCDVVLMGQRPAVIPFCDLLDPDSARLVNYLGPLGPGEQVALELRHPTAAGHRTIKYQFFSACDGTMSGMGIDRTEEAELIAQMSTLIEDLHREIERRSELSKELARQATTDFLTGVSNRRRFDEIIKDEWGRMKRYKNHFALLLIDLDHFKDVNDRFGHQTGDEVLKRVAEALKQVVRAEDVVARYGGEEFAIIALAATAPNARDLAERLRMKVQAKPMPAGVPVMTITVGVASTLDLEPQAALSELIARADIALYRGKEGGRNRVEVHTPGA